ncbi:UDP-N-acetylmuramate dehydrogenase [Cognaticolwellia beringensis]|uniref:UDP-N-acetylenolpyruvoylglucosamine reductase n=1 Tax=Cognaticolwellia beringensis TaxID=1967665 RepID=A0A222G852_9GAMM|nr:UDP-N-acetylmuramate dehydrogenase [Cognaticolwellia beringensis]ASP47912.1 UDP-N-acetylenolpyruvoylglucosamine reductase [Cognaticolwellia beringensis]
MKIRTNFSLQAFNSFNLPVVTAEIFFPSTIKELAEISIEKASSSYILGDGTNTLFCQDKAPIIIKPNLMGIEVIENDDNFQVKVACAQNWHEFVLFCINSGIYGLENLALIPGSVGAAPVQNIGAYGIEVSDFIVGVTWFDFAQKKQVDFTNAECQFGYRDSIFKQALNGTGIITHVHFLLPKAWQAVDNYQGLNELVSPVTPQAIMAKVIQLRQAKLPEPKQLPNAGSFFKNPIVSKDVFNELNQQYSNMPFYLHDNGDVKLAAGWLIEQAGLKGFRRDGVGVHENQALVIINYESKQGENIVALSVHIQKKVKEKFNIQLVPEVRFIGEDGELSPTSAGGK